MKVSVTIELEPFSTPNFVRAKPTPDRVANGWTEGECYPLSAFDSITLDRMCEEFTAAVFKKAGKERPPMPG